MSTGENTNNLKGNDMFVSNLCDKRNSSFEELSKNKRNSINVTTNSNNCLHSDTNHCGNKKKKERIFCARCYELTGRKKKLRMMARFPCKYCNLILCTSHRFLDEHNCKNTDLAREMYKQELLKKNPGCIGDKITRI